MSSFDIIKENIELYKNAEDTIVGEVKNIVSEYQDFFYKSKINNL
jgi:hypothetical protein